jgi:hypothetical protein
MLTDIEHAIFDLPNEVHVILVWLRPGNKGFDDEKMQALLEISGNAEGETVKHEGEVFYIIEPKLDEKLLTFIMNQIKAKFQPK